MKTLLRRAVVGTMFLALVSGQFGGRADATATPRVVIAHIDTGINPYHEVFRDRSPLAYVHPSKYIPGYPKDAQALRLTLNDPSFEAAFKKDRRIWDRLLAQWNAGELNEKVFWIPGTKIVAATRFAEGGVSCPASEDVNPPTVLSVNTGCADYPILDDQGHGTMTASRMAGTGTSLCPECRIVSIEGLGDLSTKWAADQGWIDVQTNSWGSAVPHPAFWVADEAVGGEFVKNIEEAAKRHLVYFASGNGAGFFLGWTTWPSELAPTLVDGAIWVGAHDNGRVTAWSGAPAHVVADGFRGLTAGHRSVKGLETNGYVCCSSASSPYAASEGAAILLEARRILGDGQVGFRAGVAAKGKRPAGIKKGPLADGTLTLTELRALVKRTAQERPQQGKHDGKAHWASGPSAPAVLPYGPGDNAFCEGCWTLPVEWTAVPEGAPAYTLIGYGAVNEFSFKLAVRVMRGKASTPDRSDVDSFFENESTLRALVQHPVRP